MKLNLIGALFNYLKQSQSEIATEKMMDPVKALSSGANLLAAVFGVHIGMGKFYHLDGTFYNSNLLLCTVQNVCLVFPVTLEMPYVNGCINLFN